MNRLLRALVAFGCIVSVHSATAQAHTADVPSNEEMIAAAPTAHPSTLYVLAARLMKIGKTQQAANWMYAGQLRYRILVAATQQPADSRERVTFSALSERVGRTVNEYIAGNPDDWIAAIDWALAWDAIHPNVDVDKTKHAATINEVRGGLLKLRKDIDGRRGEIARERTKNGLQNR